MYAKTRYMSVQQMVDSCFELHVYNVVGSNSHNVYLHVHIQEATLLHTA